MESAARPTQGPPPGPGAPDTGRPALPPPPPPAPPPPTADIDPNGRQIAVLIVSAEGKRLVDGPSGLRERPDPPPRIPPLGSPEFEALLGRIVTLPSVDGSMHYRSYFQRGLGGHYVIVSGSMRHMDETIARLIQGLLLGGIAALAASVLVSSWLIRRGLAPTSRMIETATAIASGDLTRRVPDADPSTELGQLGAALNEMLGQIERGIQARVANEERLRRFVADAAHELRTPLTSLRGYAELYQQGACPDREAVDAVVHRIAAEGARMARLVDDLLLLARLDHQQGVELEPVDLTALVRDALADFRVVHPDRPLTERLDGPAVVLGDRGRLHQIIGNLLANARTHTPPGTPVRVSVVADDGYVRLTVADDGPGIALEDQPRVFERFWRADPSRVRRTGGTGLGLAIVASLVQAHGGTIGVESVPGRGAAFTVRLPLAHPAPAAAGSPSLTPVVSPET
jgi:two-component system OmpR family sensor kinase